MEQKFEGTPKSEIRMDGAQLLRSEVTNDWGSLLRWVITQNGKEVNVHNARPMLNYEPKLSTKGSHEAVLQMWKYVDYQKNAQGEFTNSKFVEVSNKLTFTI